MLALLAEQVGHLDAGASVSALTRGEHLVDHVQPAGAGADSGIDHLAGLVSGDAAVQVIEVRVQGRGASSLRDAVRLGAGGRGRLDQPGRVGFALSGSGAWGHSPSPRSSGPWCRG
ncbi:MAG: hypothetical protein OXG41_15690, partial [Acidimicrobiaceae bacterium]|nr:hypothetical protein [Acidimicrobiaceae bacterium]